MVRRPARVAALGHEIHPRLPDLSAVPTSGYSSVLAELDSHELALLWKPFSLDQLARVSARGAG